MTRSTVTGPGDDIPLAQASERWVKGFAAIALDPEDAGDLVASARRITQTVARAALQLTWQTPDSFVAVMRQAEQSNEC